MKYYGQLEIAEGLSPNKIWFTSDTHFFHSKVIGYCKRPFENAEEMNEELIARWNTVIPRDGIVFHLGDFCFGTQKNWEYILQRLKGRIYLVIGNHDIRHLTNDLVSGFEAVAVQMRIKVDKQKILLNHYPFLSYSGDNHGTWQLFGHIHSHNRQSDVIGSNRLGMLLPNQYDVGVDNNEFTPVSYRQIEQLIKSKISNEPLSGEFDPGL